jgi:phosphoribosylaminoimidazolecarboxamide formyltransferase/IMP cyclohydrolase
MIRRALISVSDKTGVVNFARALGGRGIEILSTGGTLKALEDGDVPATSVEAYTGSPEVMGGRVKTLHPRVHGGILARLASEGDDQADLDRIGGKAIDLVVCNLYPFRQAVAKDGASYQDIVENIDIGGPSMVRSAAKNHARVTIVCDPEDYPAVLAEIEKDGDVTIGTRKRLAAKAYGHTAAYDGAIAWFLSAANENENVAEAKQAAFPPIVTLPLERVATLRYGENPHQQAAWYRDRDAQAGTLALAEDVGFGAKELSFNNLVDLDAALEAVREFERPSAVVVKHTNPCGLATADTLAEAYTLARAGDPQSAFGGIVALNRRCDLPTAEIIAETFIECVVAPSFDDEALARLRKKKKLRLVATGPWSPVGGVTFKKIGGGLVAHTIDNTGPGEVANGKVATKKAPSDAERRSLAFAWQVCKHVKSNAIVLASAEREMIVGVGAGQMSRVQSVHIACDKAGDRVKGSVLASDAFFPFPDGIEAAAKRGVIAVVQPGGSVKDDEVIKACDDLGLSMIFTGVRHFRH